MPQFLPMAAAVALLTGVPAALLAQDQQPPTIDSIAVVGNGRLTASQIIGTSGLIAKQPVNYRDIQRAITALFRTGQFDDVLVEQQPLRDGLMLTLKVKERPILEKWTIRGVTKLSEGEVKGRVKLTPAAVDFLVEHGYDQSYGARPLKRSIQRYIEDPLSEKILMGDFGRGDEIEVDVAPDGERLAFRALTGTPQA